ncbi:protein VAPYRIN-like [Bradysia coprophila]|uniref:protein VAPYRIN-like n=1 Tax=Bradysia coprophila TaxID=38358 RepID=UPI00187DB53E|nr:protein VAPYRIN-like [Bradysia coprophila]XP_037025354.1 protein VAPYRIN-like [Bradysia coprophila]
MQLLFRICVLTCCILAGANVVPSDEALIATTGTPTTTISPEQIKLDEDLIAKARRGNLNAVKNLIERGANIKATDYAQWTALHVSAFWGRLEVVKYLVEYGADIEARSDQGDTALQLAAGGAQFHVIKYLVEHGADVNTRDEDGNSPLDMSIILVSLGRGSTVIVRWLKDTGGKIFTKKAEYNQIFGN